MGGLFVGIALIRRIKAVGAGKMGENARHLQVGQAAHRQQFGKRRFAVAHVKADAPHAGVQFEVYRHRHPCGGGSRFKGIGIFGGKDGLGDLFLREKPGGFGRGVTQNQHFAGDARFAQRRRFVAVGHRKAAHPQLLQFWGEHAVTMAVGVCFDHRENVFSRFAAQQIYVIL